MSAAVSEHPPRGPPTLRSLPECRQERGKGELCSFSQSASAGLPSWVGAAHTPGAKDQGQSWAPCLFLLALDKGKSVLAPVALGGSRKMLSLMKGEKGTQDFQMHWWLVLPNLDGFKKKPNTLGFQTTQPKKVFAPDIHN